MVPLILVTGYALGADPRRLAILGLALIFPPMVMVAAAWAMWGNARKADARPALFCAGVASELRAGASFRAAVSDAATAVGAVALADLASKGSLSEMSSRTGIEFPGIARELDLTVARAANAGAATADLFDEIGSLALAQEELRREIRVAGAPARAAVGIFVALPAFYVASRWSSGGLAGLVSDPGQVMLAAIGSVLFFAGVAVAGILVWRAR
jgi:hypothetical protein